MQTSTLQAPPASAPRQPAWRAILNDYGMAGVLLLLCIYYSIVTWGVQHASGEDAAREVVARLPAETKRIIIAAHEGDDAKAFVEQAQRLLKEKGLSPGAVVRGKPAELRETLEKIAQTTGPAPVLLATHEVAGWRFVEKLPTEFPSLAAAQVLSPQPYKWPDFLTPRNLAAVGDRIVVIAIIAIGMTMVIITGGIDLSVGSLIAFGAVLATLLIRLMGAEQASAAVMILCCLAAILACAAAGLFSGTMVTLFGIPPFIVTLALMQEGRGWAYKISHGQSINEVPQAITWLGRGRMMGIPNTVILMGLLYFAAQIVMTRTILGRYIYAIGGNRKAAHLSGVPIKRVIVAVYAICAALAGIGGIIEASRLKSGAPTYGQMAELAVIAAVVVGGTSLSGGRGKIIGTLIGAFVIAVMENGMNLTGTDPHTQTVVMGAVILGAVLLDKLKNPARMRET